MSDVWRYPFAQDKIHLFSFGPLGDIPIADIIRNNVICVTGGVIVAPANLWTELAQLINRAFQELVAANFMDDDQTLLLLASLYRPDLFEMHPIVESDWLSLIRKFSSI